MKDIKQVEEESNMRYSKKVILFILASMLFLSGVAIADSIESSAKNINMVDERFELASLVFRLAECEEYSEEITAYQKEISETFASFNNHPIVSYAKTLPVRYNEVFNFSVHIIKEDGRFILIDDIDSLLEYGCWTKETAEKFLDYLNDFYIETDYATFYNSHLPFFEKETEKFIRLSYP